MTDAEEMYRLIKRGIRHEEHFNSAIGTPGIWKFYRTLYADILPEIMAGKLAPYPVDWTRIFTPIEFMAWQDIRNCDLPFYPQFPVGKFFVDFADPVKKIAVELDGKMYHEKGRDTERDEKLWDLGWRVFRVPGKESFGSKFDPWSEEHYEMELYEPDNYYKLLENWFLTTSDGVFHALKCFYYSDEIGEYARLVRNTLDCHRYIQFPLDSTA